MKWVRLLLLLCWCCLPLSPAFARVSASSHLETSQAHHGAALALDGDLDTCWVEGAAGSGVGEWVEIAFRHPVRIDTVTVFGGDFSSQKRFFEFNHLRSAHLIVQTLKDRRRVDMTFPDTFQPVTATVGAKVRTVRLVVDAIHAGSLHSDTAVAEIVFNQNSPDPQVLADLERWRQSSKGKQAVETAEAEIKAAQKRAAQGDPDALALLESAVRRGFEPLRRRVDGQVEPGFLLAYVTPHPPAVEALKQLKRIESAAALEQGKWIAPDLDTARYLQKVADYIRAWNDLEAPRRQRLPSWGTTGVERGALASRGEPLSLAVSQDGYVYVCDIGNNRVQRFDEMGRVDRVAGGEIGLADTFLGAEVPYYVAGAQPGPGPGRFVQPLAIVAFETRDGERVAVVDAARTMQILDGDLHPIRTWKVDSTVSIQGGIGISGPTLMVRKKRLYCLWGHDLFAYDFEGTLLDTFSLPVPVRAAALYRGAIIAHSGGSTVGRYGLDAFDYGPFATVDDALFVEDMDLATGPDGFLYVHTDLGKLLKINRKGKVLTVSDTFGKPVPCARIAVSADAVYVSFQDHIHRFPLP